MSKPRRGRDRPITLHPSSSLKSDEVMFAGRRYRLVPLAESPGAAPPTPEPSAAQLLTSRELQIAALVAAGLVNKQIAAELHISEWTVSTHLRRMFAKLGVDTRAAMVGRCIDCLPPRSSA